MGKVEFKERHIETDVLCIGGGIAGLMGAIRAAEGGARVIVAEKSNVLYSGSGGMGNDHFMCYIPEVHGPDIEPVIADFQRGQQGGLRPLVFIRTWFERSHEIVKLWHQWGIPMKYNGQYEFAGHGFPGDVLTNLHYAGKEQKKILAREAEKRGAEVLNRTMCFNLLYENGVVGGAIGVNTQEDEVVVIKAKAVIAGTGSVMRLYPASTPARMFNTRLSPTCVGDGRAMAYRAGAELASMEIPMIRCGPKYMAKAGKATWAGVLRDPSGKPVGPFVDKPNNKYGDPVVDVYQDIFIDYKKTGKGPIYMDCDGLSDEDLAYMLFWLRHEANAPLLNHLDEEGIDIRKNPIEFTTYEYELFPRGGILYNERAETSLPGLFAAGDEFFGGISGAAVFGWIAGESAAAHVTACDYIRDDTIRSRVADDRNLFSRLRERQDGPDWQEANTLLQQLMWDYAGPVRSETFLEAGLRALLRLRRKAYGSMVAGNAHDLMRALEVLNLIELGELTFMAALERKETRGKHNRVDYPFTNPLLEKLLVVKKVEDKPVMEWRKMRRG
ncbi:MAG: FAD-binding protein [Syntrophorhabdales bacterium]|jgi:succinate dehydrogenase/fumarate reductase flavoprotein subunit